MVLFFPLISILYGGFLPAGLFIYWIVTTIFSIVQQYLIVGWGAMFPIFGWTPGFAATTRRASRSTCHPRSSRQKRAPQSALGGPRATAHGGRRPTVRPRERGRQGRRGRRR